MAHFYGEVEGGRGEATRLGTRNSGLRTLAASWQGSVTVRLYARDGCDMARVELAPHRGKGADRLLYDGPVSGAES